MIDGGTGDFDFAEFFFVTQDLVIDLGTGTATGEGNDTLIGIESARGGSGDDEIFGASGNNSLEGNIGNDVLRGAAGNDTLTGGDGDDQLFGGTGDDLFLLGAGADTIFIEAGSGNDQALGSTSDLVLTFSPAEDVIDVVALGLTAADAFALAAGNSTGGTTITFSPGNSLILNGVALSSLSTANFIGTGVPTITGTEGDDALNGTGLAEEIFGLGGNDTLTGNGGADFLSGGDGNDALISDGLDNLDGGAGNDFALFTTAVHANLSTGGLDVVTVLNDGSVDLSGVGAAPTAFNLTEGVSRITNVVANAAGGRASLAAARRRHRHDHRAGRLCVVEPDLVGSVVDR